MRITDTDTEPVFVVGMNGSGTTMLLDCLGRHPALYAFPRETRLIPYLIAREGSYGPLEIDDNFRRLWDDVRNLTVFQQTNDGKPVPLPRNWRDCPRTLGSVLDAVFTHFAAAEGKQRWCEKTPQHVQHLMSLAREFPAASFIHVIRDGRDCAASFHRRWRRRPELTVFRWKKVVESGRDQGRRLGAARYLEVRFEDLTIEPEKSLRRICVFLGLPFNKVVLDSSQPYLQVAAGRATGGLLRNSGRWRDYFSAGTAARLERIAGRTLAACGYVTQAPDCDEDVPGWRRKYWSVTETVRQYSREIYRKLNGDLERPWHVILVKPLNALRQRQHNEY